MTTGKKIGRLLKRMKAAKRGKGKFCYCCVVTPKFELRAVNRARRRLDKQLTKEQQE